MIKVVYDGSIKYTTAFQVVVSCQKITTNQTVANYQWYIPDEQVTTTTQVIVRAEHSSTPSNAVSCPIKYFLYETTSNAQYSGSFLAFNIVSGLLTVNINIVDTQSVKVVVDYIGDTFLTNNFTVSVVCAPYTKVFYALPIYKTYRLYESAAGYKQTQVIPWSEFKQTFNTQSCRWCSSNYKYSLVFTSNNTVYSGTTVQIDDSFNVLTFTSAYFSNTPFWLQLTSTDSYCA